MRKVGCWVLGVDSPGRRQIRQAESLSGTEFLATHDTGTIRVLRQRQTFKKQRTPCWMEENWPSLKKTLLNSQYPDVRRNCDGTCLELGLYPVPQETVFNVYI